MPDDEWSLWKCTIWGECDERWCDTGSVKHAIILRAHFIVSQNYATEIRTHPTHTLTRTHTNRPIQTSLRSHHLPFSEPAVSDISYPQHVSTRCVDTNTLDSIAAPMPHTPPEDVERGCLVNLNPANPPQSLFMPLEQLCVLHLLLLQD